MISIVAFMQNPWFPLGTKERHIIQYRDDQKYHQRLLLNTMSGRRLKSAFGNQFEMIWWDNANWRPDWMIFGNYRFDREHVQKVIEAREPDIVLSFGTHATDAVMQFIPYYYEGIVHAWCHHPNARHKTQHDLDLFAREVQVLIQRIEHNESIRPN